MLVDMDGTLIERLGVGFSTTDVVVLACNNPCRITSSTTVVKCLYPETLSSEATLACDVSVIQDSGTMRIDQMRTKPPSPIMARLDALRCLYLVVKIWLSEHAQTF